jgi:hypothetical protein
METTPDTVNYMIAGYTIFFIVMAAYLASLYTRWRNLEREQQMLDEIVKKEN